MVREQLVRIGHQTQPDVRDCIPSPRPYAYRNRIQLMSTVDGKLGYRARGSHDVVAIDQCPIAHEALNQVIAASQAYGRRRFAAR